MTSKNQSGAEQEIQPLVSVIMNCYNGEKYLREAIDSVFSQTYEKWEIIFWDNASTDNSGAIARKYQDKRLRYYNCEINKPLGAARNEALDKARGEFVTFLDTDDIWYPQKLLEQVSYFSLHPEIDFIYSNLKHFVEGSKGKLFGRKNNYLLRQPDGYVFKKFLKRYPVNLQTVMIRHASLKEMEELFDPKLQIAEEFDLFMRFCHDHKVGYLHKAMAMYRLHAGQESRIKNDLYATEAEYISNKLQKCFPGSNKECKDEYEYFKAKVNYYRARAALRQGDKAKARKLLHHSRWLDWRFLVLNISLCMPRGVFILLHKMTGRYH